MDIYKAIRSLYEERKRLDLLIASLEDLQKREDAIKTQPGRKRRGRKSMGPEERLEVSERMKKYWAERRKSMDNGGA